MVPKIASIFVAYKCLYITFSSCHIIHKYIYKNRFTFNNFACLVFNHYMNSGEIPIYESNIFSDLPNAHPLFKKELYPFLHPKPKPLNCISILGVNNSSVYN